MSQCANTVLMVEPAGFLANPETLPDNSLQHSSEKEDGKLLQEEALKEFNALRTALEAEGVKVLLYKDYAEFKTPDSIFPNNWFSTHAEGALVLYPMKVENRRRERRPDIINDLRQRYAKLIDLRAHEEQGQFLESTGSLVLDRLNKIAYACLSERTNQVLLKLWAKELGYKVIAFHAYDQNGQPIYHTNCMLGLGEKFAVLCLEAVKAEDERQALEASIAASGHQVIAVSLEQMHAFCPNLLELKGAKNQAIIAISSGALKAFNPTQRDTLQTFGKFAHCDLTAIETYGGGGARCMLAEIF